MLPIVNKQLHRHHDPPMRTLSIACVCSVFVCRAPLRFPSATSPSNRSWEWLPILLDRDSSPPMGESSRDPCRCSWMSSWLDGFRVISWVRGCTAAERCRRRTPVAESGTTVCWSSAVLLSPFAFCMSPWTRHRHLLHSPAFVIFEPPLVVMVMSLLPSNHVWLWPSSSKNFATVHLERNETSRINDYRTCDHISLTEGGGHLHNIKYDLNFYNFSIILQLLHCYCTYLYVWFICITCLYHVI